MPDPTGPDLTYCRFPEHDGERWVDVLDSDRPYMEWLVSGKGPFMPSELYDAVMELLEEGE